MRSGCTCQRIFFEESYPTYPNTEGTFTNLPCSNNRYGKSTKMSPSIAGIKGNRVLLVLPGNGIPALADCKVVEFWLRKQAKGFGLLPQPAREANRSNCHSSSETRNCAGKNGETPNAPRKRLVGAPPKAIRWRATLPAPALAPIIVTCLGSPPN